ncbi:MAG: beta-galactosidase [Verrucomicrobia bacterium]|nr:beta-galactosidase [Verrucomicrobiota bacterium]MCH8528651.1 beta-galactosidase [Kiritimatiellia bacterium]
MKFGVQYYPEHWPRDRWAVDAKMMQRAGVNVVRMGEFAWSAYEPKEGALDFTWMEEAIALLSSHGIRTILCTCSRTPPPWLYQKHPGIVNCALNGNTQPTDERYRVGLAHGEFIAEAQRIDGAVIRHFAGNKHIVGWQVDNEIGASNDCFCPRCREKFQEHLRQKYSTPGALNEAWGSHFWSYNIEDFSEVPTPHKRAQPLVEYRRFMSGLNVEFSRWRADLIRELDPGKLVTTNYQNIHAQHTDCHALGRTVDVNGMNHYPARTPELAIDYYRGARGEVWCLEQHTRLQHHDTPAGRMRLWAWMAIAHGATGIVYFRWRQCRWGQEQFGDGLLPHSGEENRFYGDLSRIGAEIKHLGDMLAPTRPRAKAAIVFSYESRWSFEASGFDRGLGPVTEAVDFHKALSRRLTAIDAMDPRENLSAYRLVIAPRLWMVDQRIADNLRSFVGQGGTLCLTTASGVVDEYSKSFDTPRPGRLQDLAGVTVSDLAFDKALRLPLASDVIPDLDGEEGSLLADEVHPTGATVIATHAAGWRKGSPAITMHTVGKGRVVYVGVRLSPEAVQTLTNWLCETTGFPKPFELPNGVSACERACDDYTLLFFINYRDDPQNVQVGEGWIDAFTGESVAVAEVPANDLRILRSGK